MSTRYYFRNDFLPYEAELRTLSKVYTLPKGRDIPVLLNGERYSIYILEGQVISRFIYMDGREKWNYFFEKGCLFPILTENSAYPRENLHSFLTVKQTRFLHIPNTEIRKLMAKDPDFAWTALAASQEIITNLLVSSLGQLNHTTKQKVCSLLATIVHDDPGDKCVYLNQEQISHFVGCTQPQVTEIMRELKQEGIIETAPSFIRILDLKELYLIGNLPRAF